MLHSLVSIWVILGGFCGGNVFANQAPTNQEMANTTPMFVKEVTSGYVPEEQAFSLRCEIYPMHYKMTWIRHDKTSITMKHIQVPKDIQGKIAEAANGQLTYRMAPADIGNRIYRANLIDGLKITPVDLGSTIDSQSISENAAPQAAELRTFLDQTCLE
jgi:hypothetical protein